MQILTRILFLVIGLLAIGFALWLSITLIGVFLLVGGALVLGYAVRQFLLDKGILNPKPGVSTDGSDTPQSKITVIETTYTRVDEK